VAELSIKQELPFSAEKVWGVVGVLDRVDWVPGIDKAEMKGDQRHMHMQGAGDLVETIYLHDPNELVIEYGVTESSVGIEHHRARLAIVAREQNGGQSCEIDWALAVEPDAFAGPIKQTMRASIEQLIHVLENGG